MNNTYLSDAKIAELTARAVAIAPASDVKRLRRISEKYGFELAGSRTANISRFWAIVCAQIQAEPRDGKFFQSRTSQHFYERMISRVIIEDYIRFIGAWDDYELLSLPQWQELETFVSELRFHGCDFAGGANIFYKSGGDYAGFFAQFSKKYCDPELTKQTDSLRETILKLFKNCKTDADRFAVYNACGLLAADPGMDPGTFHNTIAPQP